MLISGNKGFRLLMLQFENLLRQYEFFFSIYSNVTLNFGRPHEKKKKKNFY